MSKIPESQIPWLLVPAVINYHQQSLPLQALIDSGVKQSFLDANLILQESDSGIAREPLPCATWVSALNGTFLAYVSHIIEPIDLIISGNHHESIWFFVFNSQSPLVLGFPWLEQHNLVIDWSVGKIVSCSTSCHVSCLHSSMTPSAAPAEGVIELMSNPPDLSNVPTEYHVLAEVFSKERAMSLPPHCPYDCSIDLLPCTICHNLKQWKLTWRIHCPQVLYVHNPLLLVQGSFLWIKKVKTLRPCIDYRGLNNITVKNKYPLPLISSAFEPLQGATFFTKLELRNAYHLVRIKEGGEWKTDVRQYVAACTICFWNKTSS